MARYAIVQDGVVVNVIELDPSGGWSPPSGAIVMPSDVAGIGWVLNGEQLIDPTPPPPQPIAALSSGGPVVIA